MSYRSLIVHVDSGTRSERRMAIAARIARTFDATLAGVYLVPGGEISPFTSAMMPAEVVAARLRASGDAQRAAETSFREACATASLERVEWRAPAGDPVEAGVLHARYADLAVLGQPAADDPQPAFASELASAVLMRCGRPLLFVPFAADNSAPGRTVLVALKDAREAARAIADAMPMLARAQTIHVVTVSPQADTDVHDTLVERHVLGWLARHGIAARFGREVAPDLDAGNVLLSQAADLGADLIVLGAYSRPRLTEAVLGGVTRLMLSSMTVPVLMSH